MTLEGFKANYLTIGPYELAHFLLKEGGQYDRDTVNPSELLGMLKLDCLTFSFDTGLPAEVKPEGHRPRALLSFPDRLVAVDEGLRPHRARFSVLHEIAHYVLPAHQHSLYLCDSHGMSHWTRLTFEKEANEFAADLLFKGGFFAIDAAGRGITVKTIAALARKYDASFEATARRLVEKSLRPVMLVVFRRTPDARRIDIDAEPCWEVHYCIASSTFNSRFFTSVKGRVPPDIASELTTGFRDIEESIRREICISGSGDRPHLFRAEFFTNTYNILCLLISP